MPTFIKNNSDSTLVFKGGYITVPCGEAVEVSDADAASPIFDEFLATGALEKFEADTKSFLERIVDEVKEVVEEVKEKIENVFSDENIQKVEDKLEELGDKVDAKVDAVVAKVEEKVKEAVEEKVKEAVEDVKAVTEDVKTSVRKRRGSAE